MFILDSPFLTCKGLHEYDQRAADGLQEPPKEEVITKEGPGLLCPVPQHENVFKHRFQRLFDHVTVHHGDRKVRKTSRKQTNVVIMLLVEFETPKGPSVLVFPKSGRDSLDLNDTR